MAWFTAEATKFLDDLAANNDRDWFHANKKRYETHLKAPMLEFAGEMIERMRELDPGITMLPKDAVFRIHRDTRFSKNRAPYKTNAGMVVSRGIKHQPGPPGLYFHLDAGRMAIASGCYFVLPDQVSAIRAAIAADLDGFDKLVTDPAFVATFREVVGERNKVLPAELREAAVRQPLLFNKQFFYWAEHPAETAYRDDLADVVMEHMRVAWPLNAFFNRAIGF